MATLLKIVIGGNRYSSLPSGRVGSSQPEGFSKSRCSKAGFSLVEVVIALAVMASSFLVIFGLLGTGLNTFNQSKAITVSSQIAQQVFSQLENIQFGHLVAAGSVTGRASLISNGAGFPAYTTQFMDGAKTVQRLFFDDQGNEIGASSNSTDAAPAGTIYWVNVSILYPSPILPKTPLNASSPYLNFDLATILVQVAYNPGGLNLAADGTTLQWTGKTTSGTAVRVVNYPFSVNRNS